MLSDIIRYSVIIAIYSWMIFWMAEFFKQCVIGTWAELRLWSLVADSTKRPPYIQVLIHWQGTPRPLLVKRARTQTHSKWSRASTTTMLQDLVFQHFKMKKMLQVSHLECYFKDISIFYSVMSLNQPKQILPHWDPEWLIFTLITKAFCGLWIDWVFRIRAAVVELWTKHGGSSSVLLLMSMFPVEGGLTEGFLVFLSKILLHLTVKRNSHLIVFCVLICWL